jgi:hypothetical protein
VGGATRATPASSVAMQTSWPQNENTSSGHCWHLAYVYMRCVDRSTSLSASVFVALMLPRACLLKQLFPNQHCVGLPGALLPFEEVRILLWS